MTGTELRAQRIAHHLTQATLAEALGVSISSLNRWEKGHTNPGRLAQRAMASYFATMSPPPLTAMEESATHDQAVGE